MKLRIFTEPQQGASYEQLLAIAQRAESLGFDAFFRSDHFLKMGNVTGEPGPSDAWTTLAGIARETSRIRLGTLVNSVTFRHPALLAIAVANVDAMSNGRVELGLGAGWYREEHEAYGFSFPDIGARFDILTEQLAIIDGLWRTPDGERFSYDGKHFTLSDSPALPKPVQSPPPIIVGGRGTKRTPMLAARHASEFNMPFVSIADYVQQRDRVRDACVSIGRDPSTLTLSAAQVVVCAQDVTVLARRASAIGREVDELRQNGLCGTPDDVLARIAQWAEIGVERLYLQILDLDDLEHLDEIGTSVLPHV
jgi:F420-dependent oxidoreductase-like protein